VPFCFIILSGLSQNYQQLLCCHNRLNMSPIIVTTLNPSVAGLNSNFLLCRPSNTNKGKRLFQLPVRKQAGRPFILRTGHRGRPRKLPSGTTEWLCLSQNNKDIFRHLLEKEKACSGNTAPCLAFIYHCKFPFLS